MKLLKKVCVLKQVANGYSYSGKEAVGMAKCEKKGEENSVNISLIDIAPLKNGKYVIYLLNAQKGIYFNCEETGAQKDFSDLVFNLEQPLCITLICDDNLTPFPVLFGQTENSFQTPQSATENYILQKRKDQEQIKKEENFIDSEFRKAEKDFLNLSDKIPDTKFFCDNSSPDSYADDVVATENYFEKADVDAKTLTLIENLSEKQDAFYKLKKSFENETFLQEEKQCHCNEDNQNFFQNFSSQNTCECSFLQEDLDEILNGYPEFYELEQSIYNSKWVKIELAKGEYYFGKASIYDKNYLCYAVKGQKENCPEELKELSCFVPCKTSEKEGFFVMFQNELDGKIFKA